MSLLLTLLAPIFATLLYGFERVLKAKMQRRVGPPMLQPFYDMFKLADKRVFIVHSFHAWLGVLHFLLLWLSIGAIMYGVHLLFVIFMHLFALITLVIAGFSVRSVFSHVGANRELIALVVYEPILILIAVSFFLSLGSFEISQILSSDPLIYSMPLGFLALLMIIPIKLKKSPFDSVEAHQEIVGGVEIEYSGLFYEFIYGAKVLEYVFIYAFVFLFGGNNYLLGAILVALSFLVINLVDNSTARVKYQDMSRIVLIGATLLATLNILGVLYV